MGFQVERPGQVGQGTYWLFFAVTMILTPALLFGGSAALLHGNVGTGLLMIFAILPIGIYWRVIMMRRCRDIGWPAFLPWLSFGLQFVASYSMMHSLQSARYGAAPAPSLMSMPLLLGLADFAFAIVIGCIRTKEIFNYEAVFGDRSESYDPRVTSSLLRSPQLSPAPSEGSDRYDDAIARALEAYRRGESLVGAPAPAPAPGAARSEPPRPAGGFGRRVV